MRKLKNLIECLFRIIYKLYLNIFMSFECYMRLNEIRTTAIAARNSVNYIDGAYE